MELLLAREEEMDRFRPMLSDHETDELDATKLSEQASVLMPSLSRIVRLLEYRGLIETRRGVQDGRRALAGLTAKGRDFIQQIAPHSVGIYNEIERLYGTDRLAHLLDELKYLVNCLKK